MKKLLSVLLALVLVISAAPLTTDAHNGKQDALGGHFSSKDETYHFHKKSKLLANVKTKQQVVNLIKKYNENADEYKVSTKNIDWTKYTTTTGKTKGKTFKQLYGFVPK